MQVPSQCICVYECVCPHQYVTACGFKYMNVFMCECGCGCGLGRYMSVGLC